METQETNVPQVEGMQDADLDALMVEKADTEEAKEAPKEEVKTDPPTEKTEPTEETDAPKKEDTVTDTEKDRLAKQVKDKEDFIQKQAHELGELRKRITEAERRTEDAKKKVDASRESFYDDPIAATEAVLAKRQAEADLMTAQVQFREQMVKNVIPEFDELKDGIAELALREGARPEDVAAFKANPWYSNPDIVINLAHRVKLQKRITDMEAKIETLAKKPEEVLKKVEETARNGRTLTAASGLPKVVHKEVSPTQIHAMSDAELDEFLKNQ